MFTWGLYFHAVVPECKNTELVTFEIDDIGPHRPEGGVAGTLKVEMECYVALTIRKEVHNATLWPPSKTHRPMGGQEGEKPTGRRCTPSVSWSRGMPFAGCRQGTLLIMMLHGRCGSCVKRLGLGSLTP